MKKTFTYKITTKDVQIGNSDEYEIETVDFEYEVDSDLILEDVSHLIFVDYFAKGDLGDRCDYACSIISGIKKFIWDNDILDLVIDPYEEELKDIYREEAIEQYNMEN